MPISAYCRWLVRLAFLGPDLQADILAERLTRIPLPDLFAIGTPLVRADQAAMLAAARWPRPPLAATGIDV